MNNIRPAAVLLVLTVIAGLAVACSRESSGPKAECAPSEGPITHGPRVGAITESTAKIWVRGCEAVDVNVQYRTATAADWTEASDTAAGTDLAQDGVAVVELTDLAPATSHLYRLTIDSQPSDSLAGAFRTLPAPDRPGVVSFVFGADIRPEGSRAVYEAMAATDPDFALLIGDQIYVDPQLPPEEPHFEARGSEDYEAVYRAAWEEPAFRRFIASVPTLMMWDDHEILNDWDEQDAPPYAWALSAYDEYQHSANPVSFRPGGLYYVVRAGPAELFVLDERSNRSANNQRDDQQKTMLGRQQKADLQLWLLNSTAKFKFIVSPVMWSDYAKHTEEAWVSFKTERNDILDYVRDHRVPGVVLLSGDEHWTGVFRLDPWDLYELSPTPLAGFSGAATDAGSPDILFKLGQTAVFGSVTVDTTSCPATLVLRVNDAFGQERFALPLTEADLVRPVVAAADYCAASQTGELDSDSDGCSDATELGDDEKQGGRRDPLYHWDFYDVNGDRQVDSTDAIAVADELGVKLGSGLYDPALDRSEPPDGATQWNAGPPDGIIDETDVLLVAAQVGHGCATAPVR